MPRSLRIQSTAKPKSNLSATIVLPRFSICHDCAAPLLITSSTRFGIEPRALREVDALGQRLHESGDADLVDHLRQLARRRCRPSASPRARSARAPASAFAKTSASPPTMIVSLPFSAPAWPPDTGASRKSTPRAFAARVHLARDFRRRGRVIDEDRARASCPPSASLRDGAHVVVVADAHQHDARRRAPHRPATAPMRPPCCATHCAAFAGVRL